jgi:hypothetical protein
MELADFVSIGNQDPALRYLIIGGWAVAAHGHTRSTFDVDFLTRQADREAWLTRLTSSGLNLLHESESFAQFTQKAGDGLDLMFVNDATFTPMWDASEERRFVNAQARVPCLDHLLALKLHALRQRLTHRTSKDADDLEVLLRRHRIDLSEPHYEALFLKYGTRELYETFVRILRHR